MGASISSQLRPAGRRVPLRDAVAVLLVLVAVALWIQLPALDGPLLSDDVVYLVERPYMEGLSLEHLRLILDPRADPAVVTMNWAPLHLLAHAVQHELFGSYAEHTRPYHLTNALLHALCAALFAWVLLREGVAAELAAAAGLLFLVHPAQVEAVAWIFQLKTLLSFAATMAVLALWRRHPALATTALALGLLAKATTLAALPWVAIRDAQRARRGEGAMHMRWLVIAALVFAAYAVIELGAFERSGAFHPLEPPSLGAQLLTILGVAGRYAPLILGSWGVSTAHQPPLPQGVLDPWVLLGVAVLGAALWLLVRALRRGHPSAGWLAFAAASYLPVSQIFPFRYPMADRYVYFLLPGLLGAAALALTPPWEHRVARPGSRLRPIALGLLLLLAMAGAYRAHQRAKVFSSQTAFAADAAAHYPQGTTALLMRARRLAAVGRLDEAVAALEAVQRVTMPSPLALVADPGLARLRGHPGFAQRVQQSTRWWRSHLEGLARPTRYDLIDLAQIHLLEGHPERAEAVIRRALATEGTAPEHTLRALLAQARAASARKVPRSAAPDGPSDPR